MQLSNRSIRPSAASNSTTIKEAPVKRYRDDNHTQLQTHLQQIHRRLQRRPAPKDPQGLDAP
jgi:hypothetical protein